MDSNTPNVDVAVKFDMNEPIGSKVSFDPDEQIEFNGMSGQVTYNLPDTGKVKFAASPIRFLDDTGEMRIFPSGATVNRTDYITTINFTLPVTNPPTTTATFRFRVIVQNADQTQTFRSSDPTIVIMRPDE